MANSRIMLIAPLSCLFSYIAIVNCRLINLSSADYISPTPTSYSPRMPTPSYPATPAYPVELPSAPAPSPAVQISPTTSHPEAPISSRISVSPYYYPITPATPISPAIRPYPLTPTSPGVSISLAPSISPSYAITPVSSAVPASHVNPYYPGTPTSSPVAPPYPATPTSPALPISPVAPPYPATPISPALPVSSAAPPYPATHISPALPISPATPPYPATPISPALPISPATLPYPATPISPALPISPATSQYPAIPPPGIPISPINAPSPSYPPRISPPPPSNPSPSAPPQPQVYSIKAAYWPSFNGLEPSDIDTSYFTHIYYAFLLIEPTTFKLNVTSFHRQTIPSFLNTLRAKNTNIKALLSIGGYNLIQAQAFATMSSSNQTRSIFINSTIEVARSYGFDGLDLDWEFPSNDQEMVNFGILLQEWKETIDFEAKITGTKPLLLSSAVYYASRFTNYGEQRSYPAQAINNFLDWINPMCYDYHGSWTNFTGPNSALFDNNGTLSTSYGIGSWLESGVLPGRIVMGVPLYGRTWTLKDPNVDGIGAEAIGPGPGDGALSYSEILEFNVENNGAVYYEGESVFYYSVSGNSWIGYDDVMSMERKIRFARSQNLAGYFFWALGQDRNWTLSKLALKTWEGY